MGEWCCIKHQLHKCKLNLTFTGPICTICFDDSRGFSLGYTLLTNIFVPPLSLCLFAYFYFECLFTLFQKLQYKFKKDTLYKLNFVQSDTFDVAPQIVADMHTNFSYTHALIPSMDILRATISACKTII